MSVLQKEKSRVFEMKFKTALTAVLLVLSIVDLVAAPKGKILVNFDVFFLFFTFSLLLVTL